MTSRSFFFFTAVFGCCIAALATPSREQVEGNVQANPYSGPATNGFYVRGNDGNITFVPNGDPSKYAVLYWYVEVWTHDNSKHWGSISGKTIGDVMERLQYSRDLMVQSDRWSKGYHSNNCYHNVKGPIAFLNWVPDEKQPEKPTSKPGSTSPGTPRSGASRNVSGDPFNEAARVVHGEAISKATEEVLSQVQQGLGQFASWYMMNKSILDGRSLRDPVDVPNEVGANVSSYLSQLAENAQLAHKLQMNLQQAHSKAVDNITRKLLDDLKSKAPRLGRAFETMWNGWDKAFPKGQVPQAKPSQPMQAQQPKKKENKADVEARIATMKQQADAMIEQNFITNGPKILSLWKEIASLYRQIGNEELAQGYEKAIRDAQQSL
ncbi:MAG: hypothetical protein HUU46_09300 [Candidatus Hydrogenedentes bacterium]|nr:hypothetical protein [Candidatus Hydrogenedentota bacterium]